ncbi:MAG: hypothetical protein HY260_12540, partial [Chloroflexi bacterium]|nr:hypothetical protein [Chloroflexota bacterium]
MIGLAGRLGLIAFGGVFAMLLLEGGLRLMEATGLRRPLINRTNNPALYSVFLPQYPETVRLYQPNGHETLRGPEFTFTIDTHGLTFGDVGFRDDGINGPADIVAVGDSFVLGWGVEMQDNWVEGLERATGRDVANLGVIGGTHKTARILDLYGLPLKPRLALFGVYANDLSENAQFMAWQASGIANPDDFRDSTQQTHVAFFGARKWLSENSRTYQLVGDTYYRWRNPPCRYRSNDLDLIFYPDQWIAELDFSDPAIASAWTMARQDLLDSKAAADANGVD